MYDSVYINTRYYRVHAGEDHAGTLPYGENCIQYPVHVTLCLGRYIFT